LGKRGELDVFAPVLAQKGKKAIGKKTATVGKGMVEGIIFAENQANAEQESLRRRTVASHIKATLRGGQEVQENSGKIRTRSRYKDVLGDGERERLNRTRSKPSIMNRVHSDPYGKGDRGGSTITPKRCP